MMRTSRVRSLASADLAGCHRAWGVAVPAHMGEPSLGDGKLPDRTGKNFP